MKSKPRFKPDVRDQQQMVDVNLLGQLTPGTLEHAMDYLVDATVGIEYFEGRYKNHQTGLKACDPRALLKVLL